MNQINIPSIDIHIDLPFTLNLRTEGQPLQGLHFGKHNWSRLTEIMVWENHLPLSPRLPLHLRTGMGDVISYTVRTVGFTPQTKREKRFHVTERAAMVKFVNEWIAKTVERGLKEMAAQKTEKEIRANNHRRWMAKQIEEAGGIEARRQQILREGDVIAAKEVLQFVDSETFHAIFKAIVNNEPIALDETTRANILAKHTSALNGWSAKRHIEERTQELDKYLAEIKQEEAA